MTEGGVTSRREAGPKDKRGAVLSPEVEENQFTCPGFFTPDTLHPRGQRPATEHEDMRHDSALLSHATSPQRMRCEVQ